jgi:hypothetical protein
VEETAAPSDFVGLEKLGLAARHGLLNIKILGPAARLERDFNDWRVHAPQWERMASWLLPLIFSVGKNGLLVATLRSEGAPIEP